MFSRIYFLMRTQTINNFCFHFVLGEHCRRTESIRTRTLVLHGMHATQNNIFFTNNFTKKIANFLSLFEENADDTKEPWIMLHTFFFFGKFYTRNSPLSSTASCAFPFFFHSLVCLCHLSKPTEAKSSNKWLNLLVQNIHLNECEVKNRKTCLSCRRPPLPLPPPPPQNIHNTPYLAKVGQKDAE